MYNILCKCNHVFFSLAYLSCQGVEYFTCKYENGNGSHFASTEMSWRMREELWLCVLIFTLSYILAFLTLTAAWASYLDKQREEEISGGADWNKQTWFELRFQGGLNKQVNCAPLPVLVSTNANKHEYTEKGRRTETVHGARPGHTSPLVSWSLTMSFSRGNAGKWMAPEKVFVGPRGATWLVLKASVQYQNITRQLR